MRDWMRMGVRRSAPSPGILRWPGIADAEGHAAHDIPGVPNYLGRNDLGAYELADAIFINGMGHFPGN